VDHGVGKGSSRERRRRLLMSIITSKNLQEVSWLMAVVDGKFLYEFFEQNFGSF
jgi:hypothetical protein